MYDTFIFAVISLEGMGQVLFFFTYHVYYICIHHTTPTKLSAQIREKPQVLIFFEMLLPYQNTVNVNKSSSLKICQKVSLLSVNVNMRRNNRIIQRKPQLEW